MNKKNVLVFPGGTEIGLEICKSLQYSKDIQLFSVGNDVSNHAPFVFNKHYVIPEITSKDWIPALNGVIESNSIDYIFPAYDDIIVALAQNSERINAKIISSPIETCLICRYKSKTYQKLGCKLSVPKVYKVPSDITSYPVFVKPDKGQGSQEAAIVNGRKTLELLLENNPDLITLEYLPGKEYTVDCFTDRQKGLLFCKGRERVRTRAGISMNSKPTDHRNQEFNAIAHVISEELTFRGAWFFQLKEAADGQLKLLEVAPRISGTMATSRVLGVNFPLLSIYESEGKQIEVMTNVYSVEIDRALINRYKTNLIYSTIYVDLDDTLIIDGKINTSLVRLLYQAVNAGCKLILITKTQSNLRETLIKFHIESLFNEVIVLKKSDNKSDYIQPKAAIFIDDSFSERKVVANRFGIPTFDCSMIELLLDERF